MTIRKEYFVTMYPIAYSFKHAHANLQTKSLSKLQFSNSYIKKRRSIMVRHNKPPREPNVAPKKVIQAMCLVLLVVFVSDMIEAYFLLNFLTYSYKSLIFLNANMFHPSYSRCLNIILLTKTKGSNHF